MINSRELSHLSVFECSKQCNNVNTIDYCSYNQTIYYIASSFKNYKTLIPLTIYTKKGKFV